jgi:hypothetical protein
MAIDVDDRVVGHRALPCLAGTVVMPARCGMYKNALIFVQEIYRFLVDGIILSLLAQFTKSKSRAGAPRRDVGGCGKIEHLGFQPPESLSSR